MEASELSFRGQTVGCDHDVVVEIRCISRASKNSSYFIAQDKQVIIDRFRRSGIMEQAVLALANPYTLRVFHTHVIAHQRAVIHGSHEQAEPAVVAVSVVVLEYGSPAEHIRVKRLRVVADPYVIHRFIVLCHCVLRPDEPQSRKVRGAHGHWCLTVAHVFRHCSGLIRYCPAARQISGVPCNAAVYVFTIARRIVGVACVCQVVVLQHRLIGGRNYHAVSGYACDIVVADAHIFHVRRELCTGIASPCQHIVADPLHITVHHDVVVDLQVIIRAIGIDAAAHLSAGAHCSVDRMIAHHIMHIAVLDHYMLKLACAVKRIL